ncbi:cellulose biosynthesis protein BcsD [Klebsiella variicola]|uniref:cellulose biosynthesis protein BcsD n=1 Tax=Klebsiella variicola TaxID=244366 RepID=UPI0007D0C266|nr:cellulose biosynthesis protein BcsD [Klebsiella variicola]SBN26560.1 Cellulose synthase operon protein YhjD [Klebsiella variicola]VGP88545.1 Cellulose synthase operon protein D [Klebsiella variicola]
MMTENNNPVVTTWFQQQQTPAGWFDLLVIMVEGMLNNAGELESQPFLRQMGASLAETHPLPASETVGELEVNINRLLTHFHWGVVTIDVGEDGLRLRHQALPVSRDDAGRVRWCNAFCAILEGLYSRWLQSQGGSAHVVLQRERVFSVSDVQFLYYHP